LYKKTAIRSTRRTLYKIGRYYLSIRSTRRTLYEKQPTIYYQEYKANLVREAALSGVQNTYSTCGYSHSTPIRVDAILPLRGIVRGKIEMRPFYVDVIRVKKIRGLFVQGSPCTPESKQSFFVQGSPCTPESKQSKLFRTRFALYSC